MYDEKIVSRVQKAINDLKPEMASFLRDFIRIETENPPGNNYEKCVKFLGNKMESLGCEVSYIQVPEDIQNKVLPDSKDYPRFSVIGKLRGENERPAIHFSGHYDVVPAGTGWKYQPYEGAMVGDTIYGRGASDMKSGVAAQIFVIEAIKKCGFKLKGSIVSSSTPDEETGGELGMGFLTKNGYVTKDNTDYCVITEPLNYDHICVGHRGTFWFKIKVTGIQSHGSMPSEGFNAIDGMNKVLTCINNEIKPQLQRKSQYSVSPPAARYSTLSTTMLSAGTKVNTIPNECIAAFDWRLIPEQSVKWAKNEITTICEKLKAQGEILDYEIQCILEVDPTIVDEEQKIVNAFKTAGKKILGRDMGINLSPGMDDQRYVVKEGRLTEAIVYGPGRLTEAHKVDESIDMNEFAEAVKIMTLATLDLIGYNDEIIV